MGALNQHFEELETAHKAEVAELKLKYSLLEEQHKGLQSLVQLWKNFGTLCPGCGLETRLLNPQVILTSGRIECLCTNCAHVEYLKFTS